MLGRVLVALAGIVALTALVLLIGSVVRTTPATAQAVVAEESSLLTACQSARALANLSHLNVSRCRKVAVVEEGTSALVTVKVWVDGQGVFIVSVGLMRTVWSQQAILVSPA